MSSFFQKMSARDYRKKVLKDTIGVDCTRLYEKAKRRIWRFKPTKLKSFCFGPNSYVYSGDWGEVCEYLTGLYKENFVVLNMANGYQPGGGYWNGCSAQEENMWYRSNAHQLSGGTLTSPAPPYRKPLHDDALLFETPRVCFKSKEVYLPNGDIDVNRSFQYQEPFLFYELRSAGVDLRRVKKFNLNRYKRDMTTIIKNQFEAMKESGKRHALLGAIGCGAFAKTSMAPIISMTVCQIYHEMVDRYRKDFDCVHFAIYQTTGPYDNYKIWESYSTT